LVTRLLPVRIQPGEIKQGVVELRQVGKHGARRGLITLKAISEVCGYRPTVRPLMKNKGKNGRQWKPVALAMFLQCLQHINQQPQRYGGINLGLVLEEQVEMDLLPRLFSSPQAPNLAMCPVSFLKGRGSTPRPAEVEALERPMITITKLITRPPREPRLPRKCHRKAPASSSPPRLLLQLGRLDHPACRVATVLQRCLPLFESSISTGYRSHQLRHAMKDLGLSCHPPPHRQGGRTA
jgi:hypothetical protein